MKQVKWMEEIIQIHLNLMSLKNISFIAAKVQKSYFNIHITTSRGTK